MKEEYDGERTIVKLSKAEITRIASGQIIKGFKVDVGLEVKE